MATKQTIRIRPYQFQPPPQALLNLGGPFGQSLVIAGSHPFLAAWSRKVGWNLATVANVNPILCGATPFLGKTFLTSSNTINPVQFTNFLVVAPPMTVMITARATTQGAGRRVISFGGSGSANGWMLSLETTTMVFTLGGVADNTLTLPVALANNADYSIVLTVSASTATVYYRRRDDANGVQTANVAVGTMLSPVKPLTIGSGFDGTAAAYSGGFNGHIGAFALWDRVMTQAEAFALVNNPYQLWAYKTAIPVAAGAVPSLALCGAGF